MCKCCDKIQFWKQHYPDKERFKEKYFAKIAIYTWRKEDRAIKGKQCSTVTSQAFNLNYCPECGKKL